MEQKEILKQISSKYIVKEILSYIYNIKFPFILFVHSNYFQKELELNYIDYQGKHLDKLGINFLDYIYLDYSEFSEYFDKDILKKKFNKKISDLKIGIDYINTFAVNYLKNYYLKYKEKQGEFIIEIFSPFFDLISKSEFFEHIFTIPISTYEIQKYNLTNDFISFFKKNKKYSSLFLKIHKDNDVKYLKKFNINFNHIKRLTIKEQNEKDDKEEKHIFNKFFKELFLLEGIQNLVYLNIDMLEYTNIDSLYFKKINNIKSLKDLNLNKIYFKEIFVLNLPNLEKINLQNCKQISFANDSCLNLKKFILYKCDIIKSNILLKMPKVEECILQDEFNQSNQLYNEIIDFSSLNKLKHLEAEKYDFIYLKDTLLEKVKLYSKNNFYRTNEDIIEKKMIELLINIKTLKKIDFTLRTLNNNEISKIDGENYSVKDISVNWKTKSDCILYSLQYKFLKLNKLIINTGNMKYILPMDIELKENSTCNAHEIDINCKGEGNIKLYIESFENLFKVNFNFDNIIKNIEKVFPILNDNCTTIFKLLTHFNFTYYQEISVDILNNIINNIDKIPNLKEFSLRCLCYDIEGNYKKLFKKVISLNLDFVNIEICIPKYSNLNVLIIGPNLDTKNTKKLYINKINNLSLSD